MTRTVVYQQKEERDMLLGKEFFERFVPGIKADYLSSGLIKLITGPRRSGKSVFSLQLLKDQNFAYLNFDDDLLLKNFDENKVIQVLSEAYPNHTHLLLDEVQNLPGWEMWVNKLYRRGVNLVITGSNARLLSKEMATVLTGRYLQIEMLPFSFAELMAFRNYDIKLTGELTPLVTADILQNLADYMVYGGFPETVQARAITKNYLSALFDSVLLKDITTRFHVRQPRVLYDLSHYLLTNYCNPFSFNQLKNDLELNSVATVKKFCDYLAEPYLFFYLPRYSTKLKVQQKSPKKAYVVDNGFVHARSFELSRNDGRLLENVVFVEMLRRNLKPGLELFYYRTRNDKEVDFVCRKGHQVTTLIQVCFNLSDAKTLKREISALLETGNELSCDHFQILTWDRETVLQEQNATITVLPVWKWLLGKSVEV
jgi:predicted AAA+ superfamily ATPase